MHSRLQLQEQIEATDRTWGREQLFYFSKFCLGYSQMQESPHMEVCQFAQEILFKDRFGLDLEPRGAFKTSIFSQALPVWEMLRKPNIRILLDSQALQNSIDNLGVIKRHLEASRFQFLYGNMVGSHWTAEEITISTRTNYSLRDPTVRCASLERVQVGPHYDLILVDDLVSYENSQTLEGRKRVKEHFRLLFSLLEPDGIMLVIGTRYHYEDLYEMIRSEFPDFRTRIKSAEDKQGNLYFPDRLTREFLDKQKVYLGRDFYSAQYLNDPAPEDADAKFQATWFKHYKNLPGRSIEGEAENKEDLKHNPLFGFITVDPGGEHKGSDEWCIFTAYADSENNLYFDNVLKGNWKLAQVWENLFNLAENVKPLTIGFEDTGSQQHLLSALFDEMKRRNRFYNVQPLSHARDSKESRILRLQPRYQCGSIYHSSRMGPLEDQLRRFPKGRDDVADAAAMVLEVAVSPKSRRKVVEKINSVDDIFLRLMKRPTTRHVHSSVLGENW